MNATKMPLAASDEVDAEGHPLDNNLVFSYPPPNSKGQFTMTMGENVFKACKTCPSPQVLEQVRYDAGLLRQVIENRLKQMKDKLEILKGSADKSDGNHDKVGSAVFGTEYALAMASVQYHENVLEAARRVEDALARMIIYL